MHGVTMKIDTKVIKTTIIIIIINRGDWGYFKVI